jgi:hypothetical protein
MRMTASWFRSSRIAKAAVGTYKCKASTVAEQQMRASSHVRPTGLNRIEPVVGRADCKLSANLYVSEPFVGATN